MLMIWLRALLKPTLALLCGGLLGCAAAAPRVAAPPPPDRPHLTVMSFNVNYGLRGDRATLRAMGLGEPDVICLQETNPAWAYAIEAASSKAYPHREFIHAGAAGGSGVLSRYPITRHQRLPPDAGWFAASLTVIASPLGPVQLLNVHLRPAVSDSGSFVMGHFSTKEIRLAEIKGFLKAADPSLPLIALGDFNEEPGGAALTHLIEDRGMQNLLPQFQPDKTTWRWRMYGINFTGVLDHILISPELDATSAEVFSAGRSDHLPIVATLIRKSDSRRF